MRTYKALIVLFLLYFSISSCKKQETYAKFPPPAWAVDTTGKYPASMTVVVRLPDGMMANLRPEDKIGAFIQDECRGVGEQVVINGNTVFFIMIHGVTAEQASISFKYYASDNTYMYVTDDFLPFTVDGNYGIADGPIVLNMHPIR